MDLMSSEAAYQIRRQQGLKVQEQSSAGDLLQPALAGLLGLLKVLGVLAWLPACSTELKVETEIEATAEITRLQSDDLRALHLVEDGE